METRPTKKHLEAIKRRVKADWVDDADEDAALDESESIDGRSKGGSGRKGGRSSGSKPVAATETAGTKRKGRAAIESTEDDSDDAKPATRRSSRV